MPSSKPQQVRRRNFDTELYDGTCRPSFPFVKSIGEWIKSMGASHIMDPIRYPDHVPSEYLILAKLTHENRAQESSDAFKGAHSRWQARTIQWNTDTVLLDIMGGQWSQQRILDAMDEIGIKSVEPTYVAPQSDTPSTATRKLRKQWSSLSNSRQLPGRFWLPLKNVVSPGFWTTPL